MNWKLNYIFQDFELIRVEDSIIKRSNFWRGFKDYKGELINVTAGFSLTNVL